MVLQPAATIISRDDQLAFSAIERSHFGFHHSLGRSELLQLGSLRTLAHYMESNNLSFFFQNTARNKSGWGDQPRSITLTESFDQLETGNVLIMLKSVHRHPDYARLLRTFLTDLGDVLDVDMDKAYQRPICTIILASPRRTTPYHVDDSHNLLMQVRGRKAFYVFDGTDPEILTEDERRAFWNGDVNAARLTDAKQAKATHYDLGPGLGVHMPLLYPHWAVNGDDISVAVSMNFQLARDRTTNAHSFNNLLRARGFHPAAPGHNRLVDLSKAAAFRALSALRGLSSRAV